MSAKTFFHDLANRIGNFLHETELSIIHALSPLARQIVAGGGVILINAAMDAVLAAEQTSGNGAAKFAAAKASVEGTLKAQGIPLIENAVNGAIESAVAALRESQAAAQPAGALAPAPVTPPTPSAVTTTQSLKASAQADGLPQDEPNNPADPRNQPNLGDAASDLENDGA